MFVKNEDGLTFYDWQGACIREVEIYEYYGFSNISSEEYPVIAINLKDQFYIQGHELIGMYTENSDYDWNNSDSNFAWSDSVLSAPEKVTFGSWGGVADYEQWVVIKRNTATYYKADPAVNPPDDYGVDYLKHALIESTTKSNPVEYPWWWTSNLSTISRDFSKPVVLANSSIRIDYPASSALDNVRFIEGSDWGVDSVIAYRDGVGFRWYIEDVDKLDTSEGYFYFGGTDGSNAAQRVEYRWYLSSISGTAALQTGWNDPFFRFKSADEVVYNENVDYSERIQPLMKEYTTWHTCGLKFRGFGQPFYMNIDGFVIKRNHFNDYSRFNEGLYLSGSDYLTCPMSEFDPKAGTVEFWLRPDYNMSGLDE
jgi:hypothetical protein